MIKVKICGIKKIEEIKYLNNLLPDYVGFVFAESKRKISIDTAKILIDKLDKRIKKVGVFVNEKLVNVLHKVETLKLDVIQLHGDEDYNYIKSLKDYNVEIWKALRISEKTDFSILGSYKEVDAFLLDTYSKESFGGTGKLFDWDLAMKAKKYGKVILAGGLNPDNVGKAIKRVDPYIVDVSSGVENQEGKDEYKIKKFIYSSRANIY
ncbi:MAG: phosphoribosylanthranilate isomerase [Clostridiales bacterium]